METLEYKPNHEAIEKIKDIKPFGKTAQINVATYIQRLETAPKFIRKDVMIIKEVEEASGVYVFKQSFVPKKKQEEVQGDIYVAPSRLNEPMTIKMSNIPVEINRANLEKLVIEKSGQYPLSTHLVTDRETGESRGYAFITLSSEINAKDAIKKINGVVIDGLILGAEMAKRQ